MTKEQIKDVVLQHTGRDDKVALIYTAIDLGLRQINMRWPFKQSRLVVDTEIVENQRLINVPSDAMQIVQLRIKENGNVSGAQVITVLPKYRLRDIDPRLADQVDGETVNTGKPIYAYEELGQIILVPPSNNAYTIEVEYDAIENLDTTSDSSNTPNLDEALIAFATAYVYKSIQMLTDADAWMKEYERALEFARRADGRRTAEHLQMRGAENHGGPKVYNRDYRINDFTPT